MVGCVRKTSPWRARFLAVAVLGAGAAAPHSCAWAGDQPPSSGFWDTVLKKLDMKTDSTTSPPDFVRATRPDPTALHYIPTGQTHPKHPIPVKGTDSVEATKAELDAARDAQLNSDTSAPPSRKIPPLDQKPAPAKIKPAKAKNADAAAN